jgi:cell division protein FtsI (penicillin-binding protein 3)
MLALFLLVAGRLVALQLTDAREIARAGLAGRLREEVLFAPRGAIFDRNHHVLAQSIEARYVYADPSQINAKDVQPTAEILRDLLGIPVSELVPKLSRKVRANGIKDEFEYLARRVDIETADAVLARKLHGIYVQRDELRIEPGNDLAANLIGFTGSDNTGLAGLEAKYNSLLAGQDGVRKFEVGSGGLVQIPGGYDEEKPARPGSSLELTIDSSLQYEVQRVLGEQAQKTEAYFAAAVVLDAQTSEVLAQASYPTYNAANPSDATQAQMVDVATQQTVEPGSIHKVITLGAALETRVISKDSAVRVCPALKIAGQTYRDTHPMPCGTQLTLPGLLAYSSDVGTITIADHMRPQTLYDFQRAFGLGSATGEGMPAEAPGLVQPPSRWSGTSHGSIPIGLGVSATPLQMAAVYATIANGGVYVPPRLTKATISADGTVHPAAAPASRRVLSEQNAAILRQDLEAVVTAPNATGVAAAIPGYRVAGKTGTGLYVKDSKYAPGEVGSFIGMAPADSPRFVVAVVMYTPGGSGGTVAAPAFQQMMQFALRRYTVPPTGSAAPKFALTR